MTSQIFKLFSSNLNTCRDAKTRSGILDILKNHQPDIWMMQEVNVNSEEMSSLVQHCGYNAECNITADDENTRGTAIVWKQSIELKNIFTVEECRVQTAQLGSLNLVNVYAPSGQGNKYSRMEFYGQTIMRIYRSAYPCIPLLAGDFNCVLGAKDARNNAAQKKCEALRTLVKNFNLTDAFRHFSPNVVEYTFHRSNSASRLDRFYVPDFMVSKLQSAKHHPQSFSDHCIAEIQLEIPDVTKISHVGNSRSSYWKLNVGIFDDDFEENFRTVYEKSKEKLDQYGDIADWWDMWCKPMIRTFCKNYSIQKSYERKSTKIFLYNQLKQALNIGPYSEVLRIKSEINKILLFEATGIKIRSRFQENAELERASLFHMNREIKKGKENNAEMLKIGPPGNQYIEKNHLKCRDEILKYFSALFSGRLGINGEIFELPFEMDITNENEFINDDLGKLSEFDKEALEKVFSDEELKECIKDLPRNKSPGIDGLSFELYKEIFPFIKEDYLSVQNCITERESLTSGMRQGVTRLVPKINDDVPTVEQLRPISMQISDYGIRNRMFAARLSRLMPSILKSGQLCNHDEKNILFGITNLISIIEHASKENKQAAIASFDMDHAFDRSFIPYILKVMKRMNFGDKFIRLIKDSHQDISTRFILNGLTKAILLTFSFRQGDAISMLLYLIYIEPLLVKLGKELKGFKMPDFTEVDNDYCDDVEIVIEEENDLLVAVEIFRKFGELSGAKLNCSRKSKIMGLGPWRNRETWPIPWLRVEKSLKIFGIMIFPSYQEILEENWKTLFEKFRGTLYSWNLRSLDSFQQRVDVVQIFGTSKLWYLCQILPLPSKYAAKIENVLKKFIWAGKLEKLALDETKSSRLEGGLGVVCIRSKSDALFLRQTCRMLANPESNSYKHIKYWVGENMADAIPDMGAGAHAHHESQYFSHLKSLFVESHTLKIVDVEDLNSVPAKTIYADFTSSFPPPKVTYKYSELPWDDIWARLNHPVLTSPLRDIMFLLIHNCLPTRDRLLRLNMCGSAACPKLDGIEDTEHLFTACIRSQAAWAWIRKKVQDLMPDWVHQFPSNFELIHLAYEALLDGEVLWLVAHYCGYVWDQKTQHGKNFRIDVDKLRTHLQDLYVQNQLSQNPLAYIPF